MDCRPWRHGGEAFGGSRVSNSSEIESPNVRLSRNYLPEFRNAGNGMSRLSMAPPRAHRRASHSVKEILQRLADVRAEGDRLRVETTLRFMELDAEEKELQALLDRTVRAEALPRSAVPGSLEDVPRRKRAVYGREHPMHAAVGGNLKAWADNNPVGRVTRGRAKSWTLKPPHGRPIPTRFAKYFRDVHGIPFEAWPNGVTEREYPPRAPRKSAGPSGTPPPTTP